MAIKYYENEIGLFTVIVDTQIFNGVNSSNVGTFPPWEDVETTLFISNVLEYREDILEIVSNKLKAVSLFRFYGLTTETQTFYYPMNGSEIYRIKTTGRYYENVADIRVKNFITVTGYNDAYTTNSIAPYGLFTTQRSGGSTPDSIQVEVIVSNDEMTDFKVIGMRVNNSAAVSYYVSDSYGVDGKDTLTEFFGNVEPYQPTPPENDPYAQGGTSGGGGGTGTFSRTGDTIGEHDLPTLSAVDAGFITLFAPTRGEMKSLASYLWSDLFSIDMFKKIFANPMDAILGLSIVPVQVPTSGSETVKVGNISTGVSMTKASTQYVKLSCGSLQVQEYWGAYLDYSPYTKCEIYLPYIGVHELSIDDVMGKTIKVVYYIDILSGACTAEIYSEGTCLYSFVGQCSASIPISGNDWTNVINGVMQIGAAVGSLVASGGLSAPISGGMLASGLKTGASVGGTVTASKPSVERSGSMSGSGGMLGQQNPYLIITWPKECIPASQNKFIGYPSFVTVTLGDITGFNIVESVHLENIPATSEELDEIESLLMNGVIF